MEEHDKREEKRKRIREMLSRISLRTDRAGRLTSNLNHEEIRAYLEEQEQLKADLSEEEE